VNELVHVGAVIEVKHPEAEEKIGPVLVGEASSLANSIAASSEAFLQPPGGLWHEVDVGNLGGDCLRVDGQPALEAGQLRRFSSALGHEGPPVVL